MRRFTRLTNAFSKKLENHAYAVAVHFMHYNFVRIHSSLRVTPAMEAGLTSHAWDLTDLVALISNRATTCKTGVWSNWTMPLCIRLAIAVPQPL